MIKNLGEKYSPLYFLAALGFGGLAVFFFMVFMHITPHPDTVMPNFESIWAAYDNGDAFMRSSIVIGYIGMVTMILIHIALMVWNFREYAGFKRTPAFDKLKQSNAEVTLMAVPLALGMSINGAFVAALALIPGLQGILEMLMPFALIAYGAVGAYALVILANYVRRIILGGKDGSEHGSGFSFEANGGLNQILAAFSTAMVAVGFAAPSAMSENNLIVIIGTWGSMFFGVISVALFIFFGITGAISILRYGLAQVNSATLWLPVPILTLWSITVLRDRHGMQTLIGDANAPRSSVAVLFFLSTMIMAQLVVLALGWRVMRANGFFARYVTSRQEQSPAAFTLVCPGVALAVLSMFLINTGFIQNGLIARGSAGHYVLLAFPGVVALTTIWLAVTLVRNQLRAVQAAKVSLDTTSGEEELVKA